MKEVLKNNSYLFIFYWLLSKKIAPHKDFEISEESVEKWIGMFNKIFNPEDKVFFIERNNKKVDVSTFYILYSYLYSIKNENSAIIIITDMTEKKNLFEKIILIDELIGLKTNEKQIKGGTQRDLIFNNGSEIRFQNSGSYVLRGIENVDLIIFDETEIKNNEKIEFDIEQGLQTDLTKKMILDLKKFDYEKFPEIKKIKITE